METKNGDGFVRFNVSLENFNKNLKIYFVGEDVVLYS